MYHKKIKEDIRCPLEYGLSVFGGKWNSRIICVLAEMGTLRYSEIRTEMGNITDVVLSSALKSLISNGIVKREAYDVIPRKVEYSLSDVGKTVVPILQNICQWSGIFYKNNTGEEMTHCQKCDYGRKN